MQTMTADGDERRGGRAIANVVALSEQLGCQRQRARIWRYFIIIIIVD